jgi:hypothetical protein
MYPKAMKWWKKHAGVENSNTTKHAYVIGVPIRPYVQDGRNE